ncbi:sulfur carrier protein ThiS [Vibrio cyclitrophicus]|uniref:sulfur carrier protein ThiS n=1 Tax=Vibrio TaxID=662 RepID=UPI0002F15A60|nr:MULTISPECIES: sulfur carrier protein ThiS [Vibrio]OED63330.1 thiamine biosynthesis protein ThiS [Vibrio cyclitrophicus ZF99]PME11506.1 thiamine biosynthesis protein ThiS [Vibrio cyclitrophicus]PME69978.1 thiamine biosynthesis protein ThiS [Vibrio cyclitrophicus]PMH51245.1 thiamine biosynthesis protein ThiS [Vibrio cyclitrophicus]PMK21043.1 thiamine biosynthesis protein ThiS [Vibrio cyclitrophicus]
MSHITISINEQPEQVAQSSSLSDIIQALSLPDLGCVFAINNAVVPRSQWQKTIVNEGDSISLFQAIAGG